MQILLVLVQSGIGKPSLFDAWAFIDFNPKSEAGVFMVLDETFNFGIKYLSLLLLLLFKIQVTDRKEKRHV